MRPTPCRAVLAALCVSLTSGSSLLRQARAGQRVVAAADNADARRRASPPVVACTGRYALCAAAACKPDGGNVSVLQRSGKPVTFPSATCTCPIIDGA